MAPVVAIVVLAAGRPPDLDRWTAAVGEAGREPVLITPGAWGGEGRRIACPAPTDGVNPLTAGEAAGRLAALLRTLRPDSVLCLGLRSCLVGGSACLLAGIGRRVHAPGPLSPAGLAARGAIRFAGWALATALTGDAGRLVVPDRETAARFGLNLDDPRVVLLPPAGGDGLANLFAAAPAGG